MIEIGKRYFISDSESPANGKVDISQWKPYFLTNFIVDIVGQVLPFTIEYKQGLRYFSDSEHFYHENGHRQKISQWKNLQLSRELTDNEDHVARSIRRARYRADNIADFILERELDLGLSLGNTYINRMGFLVVIDTVNVNHTRFSEPVSYDKRGRVYPNQYSMLDLIALKN